MTMLKRNTMMNSIDYLSTILVDLVDGQSDTGPNIVTKDVVDAADVPERLLEKN